MWEIVFQPVPRDDNRHGYKDAGVLVQLTDGTTTSTFARVAYVRWRTKHPLRTFKRALWLATERAEKEAASLNAWADEAKPGRATVSGVPE